MKKTCLSLILAAAMTASAVPAVHAEDNAAVTSGAVQPNAVVSTSTNIADEAVPDEDYVVVSTSIVPHQNVAPTTATVPDENSLKSRMFLEDYYRSLKNFSLADTAKYKRMTPEDAYRDINGGDYIHLSNYGGLTMDKNGGIHIINKIDAAAVIKVREGFDLYPVFNESTYDPVVKLDGQYIIISGGSSELRNNYIDSVKDNENVLSINKYYAVYEDTANYVVVEGFAYNGEKLTDEKLAEFPVLAPRSDDTWTINNYDNFIAIEGSNQNRCSFSPEAAEEIIRLKKELPSLYAVSIMTCLAPMNPEVYLCSFSEPVYVDGLSGDANIDGAMDISDSVLVMQSLANPDKYGVKGEDGITDQGIRNADSDGNGITNADALTIQKKLLKMI